MVDILVKSFNRPYYLDRCLRSIYQFIDGEFEIIVLDDGTPDEYLDKIISSFPDIKIVRSELYDKKVQAIRNHVNNSDKFKLYSIPVNLWKDQVSKSSDIFLLLEDDIWLTEKMSLDVISNTIKAENIAVTKIGWSGNGNVNQGKLYGISDTLEGIIPVLPCNIEFIFKAISLNTFWLRSILYRLGFINDKYNLPYYSLYSVAAAFFNRDYWLYLWKDAEITVNENLQLVNALTWKNKYKSTKFAKSNNEFCKTSYITSATNTYPGIKFDMIQFNHYLNEAWLQGSLDSMQNFPNDLSVSYLKQFLNKASDERCTSDSWDKWIEKFKKQYIKMGCNVE